MPRISRIRYANIRYNNNKSSIPDLTFDLDGMNTVFRFENGGGKTVQVILLNGLFTQGGTRNLQKRNYADYFPTTQPSSVIVEWIPDGADPGNANLAAATASASSGGAGSPASRRRFITGLCARRQPTSDSTGTSAAGVSGLDMIAFVGDYEDGADCPYALPDFPATRHTAEGYVVPTWQEVTAFLKRMEREYGMRFHAYRLSNGEGRAYFADLEEHRIHRDEWTRVIAPINQDENGLSSFFEKYGTSEALIGSWFLDIAAQKADPKNSFEQTRDSAVAYARQRERLAGNYARAELFTTCAADLDALRDEQVERYRSARKNHLESLGSAAALHTALSGAKATAEAQENAANERIATVESDTTTTIERKYSHACVQADVTAQRAEELEALRREERDAADEANRRAQAEHTTMLLARDEEAVGEARRELDGAQARLEALRSPDDENHRKLAVWGPRLFAYYTEAEAQARDAAEAKRGERKQAERREDEARHAGEAARDELSTCDVTIQRGDDAVERFGKQADDFVAEYGPDGAGTGAGASAATTGSTGAAKHGAASDMTDDAAAESLPDAIVTARDAADAAATEAAAATRRCHEYDMLGDLAPDAFETVADAYTHDATAGDALAQEASTEREGTEARRAALAADAEQRTKRLGQLDGDLREARAHRARLDATLAWIRGSVLTLDRLGIDDPFDAELPGRIDTLHDQAQRDAETARGRQRDAEARRDELTNLGKGESRTIDASFVATLQDAGIDTIEGANYLAKYVDEARRDELVREYPMLPYALLITESSVARLESLDFQGTVSRPVAVMVREWVDGAGARGGVDAADNATTALNRLGDIFVYSRYDTRMLHPETLRRSIQKAAREAEDWRQRADSLQTQADDLMRIATRLSSDAFTREENDAATARVKELEAEQAATERNIADAKAEIARLEGVGAQLDALLSAEHDRAGRRQRRGNELDKLRDDYSERQALKKKADEARRRRAALERTIRDAQAEQSAQRRAADEAREAANALNGEAKDAHAKAQSYADYAGEAAGSTTGSTTGGVASTSATAAEPLDREEAERLAAQYDAIRHDVGANESQAQQQVDGARKHLDAAKRRRDATLRDSAKYGVTQEDARGMAYDDDRLAELSDAKDRTAAAATTATEEFVRAQTTAENARKDVQRTHADLRRYTQLEEALPADQIPDIDFEAELRELEARKKAASADAARAVERRRACDDAQNRLARWKDALPSYALSAEDLAIIAGRRGASDGDASHAATSASAAPQHAVPTTFRVPAHAAGADAHRPVPAEWHENLGIVDNDGLVKRAENLDARAQKTQTALGAAQNAVQRQLGNLQTKYSQESDPTLGKLISALRDAIDADAQNRTDVFPGQLTERRRSLGDAIGKLERDLTDNRNMRDHLIEHCVVLLGAMNKALGKAGDNSTIEIKGKPQKMLSIEVPKWDGADDCRERTERAFDEIIDAADAEPSTADETIKRTLTLPGLYKKVVRLESVKLTLYKVERDGAVKMTWDEAKTNSGGESTLSAFIVLSALMDFAGRDADGVLDVFSGRKDWKVLPMDNPFGKMNAEYLLEPMARMAASKHVQLLCWTGLTDASITRTFPNNYVERLANAGDGQRIVVAERISGGRRASAGAGADGTAGAAAGADESPAHRIDARHVEDLRAIQSTLFDF
ncbi:hypothetical protein PSRA_0442 [Pseudoscardovia radai]|uniref:Uncharacterized protein n=1 Tax=Pseudoscardovia radai TaxID=987066 RepID=A0A261EZJ2_9BIFI|nr:hypothetical protein [Pseudoscardovia radai]OZG52253.1 hypothetical protein PSRA_0442 [Pseudoscardovia radai]